MQKAEEAADRQTGGQYHEQIVKAGDKADAYVETLKNDPAVTEAGPPVNPTEPAQAPLPGSVQDCDSGSAAFCRAASRPVDRCGARPSTARRRHICANSRAARTPVE
ncbi:MAG: antitoxin [Actinomycetota bacterium]|nr:antitoxin [Actinomycetota bacterium]